MIKELIFSGKKYFEGQVPNYVGRTLIPPKHDLVGYESQDNTSYDSQGIVLAQVPGMGTGKWQNLIYRLDMVKAEGQCTYQNEIYLLISGRKHHEGQEGAGDYFNVWIKLSDLIQNGGVLHSLLTHLYQGLRHLLDRKVALIND